MLEHRVGSGRLVLCTYPLEHMAAQTMGVNPEPTWRLYAALAEVAGVAPEVRVHDPRVIVGEMVHDSGRRFVWFINQSDAPLSFTPLVASGMLRALEPAGAGQGAPKQSDASMARERVSTIELSAFGVSVLERAG